VAGLFKEVFGKDGTNASGSSRKPEKKTEKK